MKMKHNSKHYDTGIKADLFKAEVLFTLAHPTLGEGARLALKKMR